MITKYLVIIILTSSFIQIQLLSKELRISTWNMNDLGSKLNKRSKNDLNLIKKYAKILQADIIAVQEVKDEESLKQIFDKEKYNYTLSKDGGMKNIGFVINKKIQFKKNPDFKDLNWKKLSRSGVDITIKYNDTKIRLLAVHLQHKCFDRPLVTKKQECQILKNQARILEEWIDYRAKENIPFVILGDFNRYFQLPHDSFWRNIDDGIPLNADLFRFPLDNEKPLCWDREYEYFVDHIILDKRSRKLIKPYSFEQIIYQEDRDYRKKLSDHCPIAITLLSK